MSRDIEDLVPNFRAAVRQVLEACKAEGVTMITTYTVRSPIEQAVLWRRSRTIDVISRKIQFLHDQKADFLADVLRDVGPREGAWATNAIPGASWHQFGEAHDGCWMVDGKEEWSTTKQINGVNGYRLYAQKAHEFGLTSLGPTIGDWAHIQLRKEEVTDLYSWKDINDRMKERFG
jgi:peptidoglycan L-alanyl-D-glutamate endopeptidase CwlK